MVAPMKHIRGYFPRLQLTKEDYLTELSTIGSVRFVVVGPGAILETVGSFSNLRYSKTPKGKLATVSTNEPCFECHLRLDEINIAKQVIVEKQGRTLRIIRFNGGKENELTHLSAILHGHENCDTFDNLVVKYGEEVQFE
jgi:hypothetical protein